MSEELRRAFTQYEIPSYVKPYNTIRQLLVKPKDKVLKERVVGPVYNIECKDCNATYIGETERSLKARFQEHNRRSSETSEVSRHIHIDQPGHSVDLDTVNLDPGGGYMSIIIIIIISASSSWLLVEYVHIIKLAVTTLLGESIFCCHIFILLPATPVQALRASDIFLPSLVTSCRLSTSCLATSKFFKFT